MKPQEKNIYNKIKRIIQTPNRYDEQKNRYILDLEHGFLFYYPDTGKVLHQKESRLKTIFRNENTCWVLEPELKELLTKIME
jgi:hypothetical protein